MSRKAVFRRAKDADAAPIAKLLRDSIRQLCLEDHHNAERPLDEWLANKTPESVRRWIENPDNCLLVAEVYGEIAAVGGVRKDGHIILNYVAPAFQFQGVSKQMVAELEQCAEQTGVREISLESTVTARAFYLSLGYKDAGAPGAKHGLTNFPMIKHIS